MPKPAGTIEFEWDRRFAYVSIEVGERMLSVVAHQSQEFISLAFLEVSELERLSRFWKLLEPA